MTKPTKYPDWTVNTDGTDNDVVDPTSGQNNVVEPDAGKKLMGWGYAEKPPRQYFNWLSRLTTQWIRWFDEVLSRDTMLLGTCPNSTALLVNLPSGYTVDNTIILGGNLYSTGIGSTKYPLFWYGLNGLDTSYISTIIQHSPDQIAITWFEGSALKNLNGYSYVIAIRKIP